MVTAPAAIMLPGPYCASMGWLLDAWLALAAVLVVAAAVGAWLVTGPEYRGVHRGPVYPGHHRLREDERTQILRWDGARYVPARHWTPK